MSDGEHNGRNEAEATKVSRRDFAKSSVAAGAAAVALPGAVRAEALTKSHAATTAATARKTPIAHRIAPPPKAVGYGGSGAESIVAPTPATAKRYASGWQPGTTIPAEYYLGQEQYERDEAFLKENQWMFADHV